MSITDNYREKIRSALLRRAGDVPDASAVAEATISTWHLVAAQLMPVIGAGGVDVLFSRSLYLTSASFPCLTIPEDHQDTIALLANLKEHLAVCEPDIAAEASNTLLGTFVELLMSLIGESLVKRLLISVWEPPSPTFERENET